MAEFKKFPSIGRYSRDCTITEKIDGTNGLIYISDDFKEFEVGSRTRWITPQNDNMGFAKWAYIHKDELITGLGPGYHYGEWWGQGIQRRYGLNEKRFSLFNSKRWLHNPRPECCHVVPVLYEGMFDSGFIELALNNLRISGSIASPGFMQPEGIVIFHHATGQLFKKTLEKDDQPKTQTEEVNV